MEKLAIGKVRTSTGVRGYFKVLSFSGESSHFKKLKGTVIELRQGVKIKSSQVEDVRMSGASVTMKLEGIDNPEDAKKLSGWEIFVERGKAVHLEEGEYYIADLCKCSLFYNGEAVGQIKAVSGNGISDLFEVDLGDRTVLIPFLEQYIGKVDIDAGMIELIEGWLLE